jgi:colanic acid biosynthesis protein WcaH
MLSNYGKLPKEEFISLIKNGPLVSIDLIIRNPEGKILLGYRNNFPAKNTWFVPGGRIYKNQRLDEEFLRITQTELGISIPRSSARFFTVAEHLYPDENTFDIPGVDTHYIVLAYVIDPYEFELIPADNQHSHFTWMAVDEILQRADVHVNTKDYFRKFPDRP